MEAEKTTAGDLAETTEATLHDVTNKSMEAVETTDGYLAETTEATLHDVTTKSMEGVETTDETTETTFHDVTTKSMEAVQTTEQEQVTTTTTSTTTTTKAVKPKKCKKKCGRRDGNFQSCKGCEMYVMCSNGIMHDGLVCPGGLVWDSAMKRCEWKSSTCP